MGHLMRSGLGLAAGSHGDTLAECVSKRVTLVRHEFSRRIRQRKGESEASLQEPMGHLMRSGLAAGGLCAPVERVLKRGTRVI